MVDKLPIKPTIGGKDYTRKLRDAEGLYIKGNLSTSLDVLRRLGLTDMEIARKFNEWRGEAEKEALRKAKEKVEIGEDIRRGQREAKKEEILKRIEEQRGQRSPGEGIKIAEERARETMERNRRDEEERRRRDEEKAREAARRWVERSKEQRWGEPTETEIKGIAPGATVTERYGRGGRGGGPPPSEGRGEEDGEGYGNVTGEIKQKGTGKPIFDAEVFAFSPTTHNNIPGEVYQSEDKKRSLFKIENIPVSTRGSLFIIVAKAPNHKQKTKNMVVKPGDNDAGILELELEKKKALGGKPVVPIGREWFNRDNLIRLALALGITLIIYFTLYSKFFSALDTTNPIFSFLIPVMLFFAIFFTLPRGFEIKDWGSTGFGWAIGIFTFLAINVWWGPQSVRFTFLGWLIPIAFGIYVWWVGYKKENVGYSLLAAMAGLAIIGFIMVSWNLISTGKITKIDTYLNALDFLHVVGIPQEGIDNFKDGVRHVLSFLKFTGAQPTKPEAKKIGGFEAIELKFGSKYNDYLLPTLYARMNYTLPVSVTNPNKIGTDLVVKDFTISEIYLNNVSSNRIFCGNTTDKKGMTMLGDISPEEDRMAMTDFSNKTNCVDLVQSYKPTITNPMYPAKFRIPFEGEGDDKKTVCIVLCQKVVDSYYQRYQLTSKGDELDVKNVKYISGDNQCECKVKRVYNIMDELCFFSNDKATATLKSSYGFKVQGKGELIIAKTEADKKLVPKPSITSGAGPLTITAYFVSDIHVPEQQGSKTVRIYIDIKNDGEGSAEIKEMDIKLSRELKGLDLKKDTCLPIPDPNKKTVVPVNKDGITISCPITITDKDIKDELTGSYLTVPVIVDMNYTYSQIHSTTIKVEKVSIPEGLTDEQIDELKQQYESLPYYCPPELQIYKTE